MLHRAMDEKILALEATRDLTRTWLHVDMDAFYAACEELHDPSLVRLPAVYCSPMLVRDTEDVL